MANGENIEFQFRDWLATNEREVEAAKRQVYSAGGTAEVKDLFDEFNITSEINRTPQEIDRFYQKFWKTAARDAGLDQELQIPDCDRSEDDLS